MPAPTTIVAALSFLVGAVFSTLTIRQWQRARYLAAAAELVHTIQTAEFTRSIALIVELPKDAPATKVLEDPAMLAAFYSVNHVFESLGVLVYHRLLPLHLVDHLVGGYVRASWQRVQPTVTERRSVLGVMFSEWFQWLAERLEEYPSLGKTEGANVAFKKWRP